MNRLAKTAIEWWMANQEPRADTSSFIAGYEEGRRQALALVERTASKYHEEESPFVEELAQSIWSMGEEFCEPPYRQ